MVSSFGLCVLLGSSPVRSQSREVDDINRSIQGLSGEADSLIYRTNQSNHAYISGLDCRQLISLARTEDRAGDYWSGQSLPHSGSRAQGHYSNVEMIYREYNSRCN
jgi:hypothetical protein